MTSRFSGERSGGARTTLLALLCVFTLGFAASAWYFALRTPVPTQLTRDPDSSGDPGSITTDRDPRSAEPEPEISTPSALSPRDQERARIRAEVDRGRRSAIVRAAETVGPAVVTVGVVVRGRRPVAVDPWGFRYVPQEFERDVPEAGSGVVVDSNGLILTNAHVVSGGVEFHVRLSDGRTLPAKLLGKDDNSDLAVLQIEADHLPAARIGDSDSLMVGEWVIAIGNPFGMYMNDPQPTVTVGVVSALHRDVQTGTRAIYKNMIQTDAAINPGNSGGPLVNSLGEVIGINAVIITPGQGSVGLGFAVPINMAMQVANDIVRYGRVRGVYIGLEVVDITPLIAQRLRLPRWGGLYVTKVQAGSPGEAAGLRRGDVIRQIDGAVVSDRNALLRAIFGLRPGDALDLSVERGLEEFDATLRLAAEPESNASGTTTQ
mgnify:CR=1 FL=1